MKNNTLRMGLLGYPVAHSKSPALFTQLGKEHGIVSHYTLFERAHVADILSELEELFTTYHLDGLNVTSPYKERVAEVMTTLSPRAASVRAVNLVTRSAEGFHGDNTDLVGCSAMLEGALLPSTERAQHGVHLQQPNPILVLGAGGAARVILKTLQTLNRSAYIHNRTESTGRSLAAQYSATYLSTEDLLALRIRFSIFSALPAYASLPQLPTKYLEACYDVAYIDSPLKQLATEIRCPYHDGYTWLYAQARENFKLLTTED